MGGKRNMLFLLDFNSIVKTLKNRHQESKTKNICFLALTLKRNFASYQC